MTPLYFNAAGADLDSEIGELQSPETHLIQRVVAAAHGEVPQVEIWYRLRNADGIAVRDYIHVADLASAYVEVLEG